MLFVIFLVTVLIACLFILNCLHVQCMPEHVYMHHVWAYPWRSGKEELDLVELEQPAAVSHHMGAENRGQVLCRSSKDSLIQHFSGSL